VSEMRSDSIFFVPASDTNYRFQANSPSRQTELSNIYSPHFVSRSFKQARGGDAACLLYEA